MLVLHITSFKHEDMLAYFLLFQKSYRCDAFDSIKDMFDKQILASVEVMLRINVPENIGLMAHVLATLPHVPYAKRISYVIDVLDRVDI